MEAATAAAATVTVLARVEIHCTRDRYEAHWLIYTGGGGGPPGAGPVNHGIAPINPNIYNVRN